MQQTTVQLKEVNGRTATVRGQVTNVYDAVCSDGRKYTIWEAPLAQLAHTLVGQNVLVTYTEKPSSNPAYPPNFTLKAIAAVGAVPVSQPVPAQNGGAAPGATFTTNTPAPPQQVVQFTTTEDKSDRIERQSAYKAAVEHVASSHSWDADEEESAWKRVQYYTEQLAYYAKHGRWLDSELPLAPAAADEDWA